MGGGKQPVTLKSKPATVAVEAGETKCTLEQENKHLIWEGVCVLLPNRMQARREFSFSFKTACLTT